MQPWEWGLQLTSLSVWEALHEKLVLWILLLIWQLATNTLMHDIRVTPGSQQWMSRNGNLLGSQSHSWDEARNQVKATPPFREGALPFEGHSGTLWISALAFHTWNTLLCSVPFVQTRTHFGLFLRSLSSAYSKCFNELTVWAVSLTHPFLLNIRSFLNTSPAVCAAQLMRIGGPVASLWNSALNSQFIGMNIE